MEKRELTPIEYLTVAEALGVVAGMPDAFEPDTARLLTLANALASPGAAWKAYVLLKKHPDLLRERFGVLWGDTPARSPPSEGAEVIRKVFSWDPDE